MTEQKSLATILEATLSDLYETYGVTVHKIVVSQLTKKPEQELKPGKVSTYYGAIDIVFEETR